MRTFDRSMSSELQQAVCPTCGRGATALEELLVEARIDLQGSESEVKRQRREITRLKVELQKQRQESPQFERAERLFLRWVTVCGKNRNVVFDPKRQKMLIDMLALYDRVEGVDGDALLDKAIVGLSKMRYVGPRGRQPTADGGARLFDDLKYAVQDASSVERFAAYVDAPPPQNVVPIRRHTPGPFDRPVDKVLEALRRADLDYRGAWGAGANSVGKWMAQCPAHDDREPSLSIREADDGRVLLNCFAGCAAVDVCSALGLALSDLFVRKAAP